MVRIGLGGGKEWLHRTPQAVNETIIYRQRVQSVRYVNQCSLLALFAAGAWSRAGRFSTFTVRDLPLKNRLIV